PKHREKRLAAARRLAYNDLSADKQVVAAVQALEAILKHHADGKPGGVVTFADDCTHPEISLPGESPPVALPVEPLRGAAKQDPLEGDRYGYNPGRWVALGLGVRLPGAVPVPPGVVRSGGPCRLRSVLGAGRAPSRPSSRCRSVL